MTDLTATHFHNPSEARKYLEALRWPDGQVCPKCGSVNNAYATKKEGVYRCAAKECRADFTVRVGTIFEDSKVSLDKWLLAFRLMAGSKKGMSANQLHRQLGVTHKTAWFMAHRIREAMTDDNSAPLGGEGMTLEVDETFMRPTYTFVNGKGWVVAKGPHNRAYKILTVVERKGRARSVKMEGLKVRDIRETLVKHADARSILMTDEARVYKKVGKDYAEHHSVNHSKGEYGAGEATTNTIEGFFSIFKRGMKGIYQHCGEQHLHRYLAEFDFRYSNRAALEIDDTMRTDLALKGAEGKRLMYSQAGGKQAA
jgi:transposase-like protein